MEPLSYGRAPKDGKVYGVLMHEQLQEMTCWAMLKFKPASATVEEWKVKQHIVITNLACDVHREHYKTGMNYDAWQDWFVYTVASSDREVPDTPHQTTYMC